MPGRSRSATEERALERSALWRRLAAVGSTNQISVTGKEYVNVTCPDGRE